MATKRCLYCKVSLWEWQKKFCSRSHMQSYIQLSRKHFARIYPKNFLKKTSPFLQELEKKDKVIMSKEWRIAGD